MAQRDLADLIDPPRGGRARGTTTGPSGGEARGALPLGGRALRLCGLLALVALAGCHVDDEVEGQPPPPLDAAPMSDAGQPDAAPGCADGATEACAVMGACMGTRTCANGSFGDCVAPAESCDGADNDCDGRADEDWADLGAACSDGVGACAADGAVVCNAAGDGTRCDAVAGAPGEEACSGADDDCDGTIDEGFGGGEACETDQIGVCRAGTTVCRDGDVICLADAAPSDEACDGLDNDCDGATDEGADGAPLVRDCYDGAEGTAGVGPCVGGTQTCEAGAFGACVGQVTPGAEICDGIDNDCNAAADDVEGGCACLPGEARDCYTGPADTAGVGACRMGRQACLADGSTFGPCEGEVVPAAETCATREQDLDCDGAVGDVPGTGDACSAGVGACLADGVTVCNAANAIACDAVAGAPGVEICDGLDNDCDGAIDDVATLGDACSVGVGACAVDGVRVCDLAGQAVVCDAVAGAPGVEICDGIDNDCDGTVDNVATLGDACSVGVGACQAMGQQVCDLAARAVVCDAVAGAPGAEICDGIDNDCDGAVDDVATLGDACSVGVGACQAMGQRVCDLAAQAVVCDAVAGAPGAEICDGIDNDCDGNVDDVATLGDACSVGVGACQRDGTRVCDLGARAVVCDAVAGQPGAEICDGIDNDCDGDVDDVAGLGAACTVGVGACATDGVRVCDVAARAVVCDALEGGAAVEICDGIDNDCNGVIDDVAGLGGACSVGVGACQRDGARVCDVAARAVVCDAVAGQPAAEICDGIDNNCNGQVDDAPGVGQACQAGVGACQRNGSRVCDVGARAVVCDAVAGQPAAEICDGIDNNCNGQVDDVANLGQACQVGVGACQRNGTRVCDVPARQLVCGAQPGQPAAEICDGIDNNCNGQVDDVAGLGQACTAGLGLCLRNGTRVCDVPGRQLICNAQPGNPGAETCDNRDQDCDGRTDEGITQACYGGPGGTQGVGTCRAGVQTCNAGAFGACQGEVRPIEEFCDGQDRDCNGRVDDVYFESQNTDYAAAAQCWDLGLGNLDRDARVDVVCSLNDNDNRLAYWHDNNAGGFGAVRYVNTPGRMRTVKMGDIDGDGDDDVVATMDFDLPHVFINNNGNLAAPVRAFAYDPGGVSIARALELVDMTGDGRLDLVLTVGAQGDPNSHRLIISSGNGNGTFAAPQVFTLSPEFVDITVGDIDQDGDLDVIGLAGRSVGFLRDNGAAYAAYVELQAFPNFPTQFVYADFTGDGRRDLVVGTEARWFFGRAQGNSFQMTETVDRGTLMAAAAGNFDCDPLPELVMTRSNPASPIVIVNDPANQALIFERYSAHGWTVAVGDVDNDGLDDIFVPRALGGFSVYRQLP